MKKIRTMFFGSGTFAINSLQQLIDLDFIELICVVTQPDKPFGRNKQMKGSPLMEFIRSKNLNLKVDQVQNLKIESSELLAKYDPELVIVASYGKIIPDNILNYPKFKCLNLHGSLLPTLRGAIPVQMSILQGFDKTGVTLQRMVTKMDEGPIISTRELQIDTNDDSETLMAKIAVYGADIVGQDLEKWVNGDLPEVPQNDAKATYCYEKDLARENAEIKFSTSVDLAQRMIRAFYPDPGAWVKYKNKSVKIFKAGKFEQTSGNTQIDIKFTRESNSLFLNLEDGKIEILELQMEGKNRGVSKDHFYLAT